ncbi:TAXI family TRAP transporter solute-binding subunit [Kribbella sp. NPDC058245]|uniref:TAXI family TRAP transporter solute-binding subunit n=1 Tax=Kribbella sp. NPDC058245 TaxID=3346399 RepID=UPI0036EAF119
MTTSEGTQHVVGVFSDASAGFLATSEGSDDVVGVSSDASAGVRRRTAVLGALALAVAGCSRGPAVERLTIAAGETGGFYLEFAQLLAIQLRLAGVAREVVVRETGGSTDNLRLLAARETDLALSLADAITSGPDLRALGRVYENYLQCVVRADSPYKSLTDLAGTTISAGARGSGAAVTAARLLTAAGVNCRQDHLPLEKAATALADRQVAAMFWSGGVPTTTLGKLSRRVPIRLLPLGAWLAPLRRTYGSVYQDVLVPAGVYQAPTAVAVLGIPNLLLCRPDLPTAVARAVTNTLARQARLLVPPSAVGAQYLNLQSLVVTNPIPLHPGAVAEYRRLYG